MLEDDRGSLNVKIDENEGGQINIQYWYILLISTNNWYWYLNSIPMIHMLNTSSLTLANETPELIAVLIIISSFLVTFSKKTEECHLNHK